METTQVNIDFAVIGASFEKYVRQKALLAGSSIVYAINGLLIEEDPKTLKKIVLKEVSYTNQ